MNSLKSVCRIMIMAGVSALAVACSSAPPTIQTGPDAEVTFDGLNRVDNSQADAAWARPDFDISQYSKIMLVGAGVTYAPADNRPTTQAAARRASGSFFIDDETRERFETTVGDVFVEEMQNIENFTIVNEAGPDVLMVRGGLLDVVSFVPPEITSARSAIFLDRVGEATLMLELRDSTTGAILARSVDRRAAEQMGVAVESNRVTNSAEVRRLIRFWARRLRQGLDGFLAEAP